MCVVEGFGMIPFTFSFSIVSATSGCNSFCFSKPKRNCFIIVCEKEGVNMRKKAIFTNTVWTFCLENNMHENYLLLRKAMSNWRLRDDVFIGNTNQVIEDPGTRVGHIFHPGYHQIQLSFNERWPPSVGITPKLLQTCFLTNKKPCLTLTLQYFSKI